MGWPRSQLNAAEKKFVAHQIGEAHGVVFHRIDEAYPIDEFGPTRGDHVVEPRQVLRRHGDVGVEDHQNVAGRRVESAADRVVLPRSFLLEQLAISLRVRRDRALDGGVGVVGGVAFDEDDFGARAHLRDKLAERALESPAVVAAPGLGAATRDAVPERAARRFIREVLRLKNRGGRSRRCAGAVAHTSARPRRLDEVGVGHFEALREAH